jgi:hypothetical protein
MVGNVAFIAFFCENLIDGKAESGVPGPNGQYRNNNTTGAWTLPAATNNAVTDGRTAVTVGGAGGAAALPATPIGYMYMNINNADVKIPYYNL